METGPVIYVVATPIGNLEDMSLRARRILEEADLIAAEDTRRTRQLLNHLGIGRKELISYYDQVEQAKAPLICERIINGSMSLALVSDAGTPAISDPGYRLIKEAKQKGIKVHPIPGASSLISLLSASGLPTDRFLFAGFLPTKSKALLEEISSWQEACLNIAFFESNRRVQKTLGKIAQIYPKAEVALGRELTKLHEEILLAPIEELILELEQREHFRGEVVVYLRLPEKQPEALDNSLLDEQLKNELAEGKSFKDLLRDYKSSGLSRSELYQKLVQLKEGK